MKKIMLTCPFTGVDFEAMEDSKGSLLAKNVFTGDIVELDYVFDIEKDKGYYAIPVEQLENVETITLTQAANLISVSKTRISQLCQSGQLVSVNVGGNILITRESAETYRDSERKAGRRW